MRRRSLGTPPESIKSDTFGADRPSGPHHADLQQIQFRWNFQNAQAITQGCSCFALMPKTGTGLF
jgi:hypothetical protein